LGEKDLERIHPVYRFCVELSKEKNWPFQWKVDSGQHETAIQIFENGQIFSPPMNSMMTKAMMQGNEIQSRIFEPDILAFHDKIIIEYEEEAKPHTGWFRAMFHKGHTQELLTPRDEERDKFYSAIANPPFKLFKVWQSDKRWKKKLEEFLTQCYEEMNKK
jgi:hypothetical protein